jgi:hypothetical protein
VQTRSLHQYPLDDHSVRLSCSRNFVILELPLK